MERRGWAWWGLLGSALLWVAACAPAGYYTQAAWGQLRILTGRRSVEALVESPSTPPELRQKLELVGAIRRFAVEELGLPAGGSFRSYVELPRREDGSRPRAVVWNVVATPELSIEPERWCYPVVGCAAYRGYFSWRRAERFAAKLRRRSLDVAIRGAAAYSTLGWFKDPLLSTVIDDRPSELAALVFHELAHRRLYVKGETTFNESFATAVEREGVRRWWAARGAEAAERAAYEERRRREKAVTELLARYRRRLSTLYAGDLPEEAQRLEKRRVFEALRADYEALEAGWARGPSWAAFFERELNNAHLAAVAAYHELAPAFSALLARHGGDLGAFYAAAEAWAALRPDERRRCMERVLDDG